jgi:catechol-2,3-dioxygenase
MKRRDFINQVSSFTLLSLLDYHSLISCHASTTPKPPGDIMIVQLQLLTTTSLQVLKKFYSDNLGFSVVSESSEQLVINAGQTQIRFIKSANTNAAPFYHFAFNIPENKIREARDWQLKKTPLLPTPAHMTDEGYANDIRHFRNWNAHSIFFWDPAGNLVEYIARHDLKNSVMGDFSTGDILYASEIAFIVNDVDVVAKDFSETFALTEYKQGNAEFRAIGDEQGLLLVMKKGRVWMGNTDTPKTPGIYKTVAQLKVKTDKKWSPQNYPYEILSQ